MKHSEKESARIGLYLEIGSLELFGGAEYGNL